MEPKLRRNPERCVALGDGCCFLRNVCHFWKRRLRVVLWTSCGTGQTTTKASFPDDHTTKQAASHGHSSPLNPWFQIALTDFPEEGQHQPRVLVISIKYYLWCLPFNQGQPRLQDNVNICRVKPRAIKTAFKGAAFNVNINREFLKITLAAQ